MIPKKDIITDLGGEEIWNNFRWQNFSWPSTVHLYGKLFPALNLCLHYTFQHLDSTNTYARILFVVPPIITKVHHNELLQLDLLVDNWFPVKEEAVCMARSSPVWHSNHQHRCSSRLHSLPTMVFTLHKRLLIQWPIHQSFKVHRWHSYGGPHLRQWWVLLQERGSKSRTSTEVLDKYLHDLLPHNWLIAWMSTGGQFLLWKWTLGCL